MVGGKVCNREVVVIEKNGSISETVEFMRKYPVGDVMVVEERFGQRVPIGILTDRDIVIELLAEDVDIGGINVSDVMRYEIEIAREGDDLIETIKRMKCARMKCAGVRRMPVVSEQGGLIGILTLDDLMELLSEMRSDFVALIRKKPTQEKKIWQ